MTAVIRRAEAVLQALIMIKSSIKPSLMSLGRVDCKMKTGTRGSATGISISTQVRVPSSSRTLSPIVTLVSWLEYCSTMILVNSMPSLQVG